MSKQIKILIVVALMGLIAFLIYVRKTALSSTSTESLEGLATPPISTVETPESISPQPPVDEESSVKEKKQESFSEKIEKFKPVNVEQARQEVAENPHTTPPSLIRSALEMGDVFDKVSNSQDAGIFLLKMKECTASSADVPNSLQATCLRYARRISQKYPEHQSQVEEITRNTSPETLRIEQMSQGK